MAYKKLTELTLFNAFSSTDQEASKKVLTDGAMLKKAVIDSFKYKDQIDVIRKRFNYTSKVSTISLLEKEMILPVYDEKNLSLASSIIAWLCNIDGKVKAVTNITMFGDLDEAYLTIDASRFFASLQAGNILLTLHNFRKTVENNVSLLKDLSHIYTRMVMKVLDRDFAINSDKSQADKATFAISKFFLGYVVGRELNATADAIAMSTVVNGTSENLIKKYEKDFTINYTDFKEFVACLAESLPALRNLTFRGFIQGYIRFFGTNTMFAVESLQYFLITIFSVHVGASLNNNTVISSVSGKHLDNAFNTFFGIAK